MPSRNETTVFYGLLVTGTSLLIAAHAFEQINDPQRRLALQRKGLDLRLRRLVLEELVPSVLESVEKELVERHRCRGCLRLEQARRSAQTLALCLLRRNLPAELRQMVMDYVLDEGKVAGREKGRTIQGLGELRRDRLQFPGGAGQDRRLRWTDVFGVSAVAAEGSVSELCYLCGREFFSLWFTFVYSSDDQEYIRDFLSALGLSLVTPTLNAPRDHRGCFEECLYHSEDVLAAIQLQSIPSKTFTTFKTRPQNCEESQTCTVVQMTHATFTAAREPTIPPSSFYGLALFGVRSTELDAPEAPGDHHVEVGAIGQSFAGSKLKEAAWTLWMELTESEG